jgi:hypothetical protein
MDLQLVHELPLGHAEIPHFIGSAMPSAGLYLQLTIFSGRRAFRMPHAIACRCIFNGRT